MVDDVLFSLAEEKHLAPRYRHCQREAKQMPRSSFGRDVG
jgi:hypothetical protein